SLVDKRGRQCGSCIQREHVGMPLYCATQPSWPCRQKIRAVIQLQRPASADPVLLQILVDLQINLLAADERIPAARRISCIAAAPAGKKAILRRIKTVAAAKIVGMGHGGQNFANESGGVERGAERIPYTA